MAGTLRARRPSPPPTWSGFLLLFLGGVLFPLSKFPAGHGRRPAVPADPPSPRGCGRCSGRRRAAGASGAHLLAWAVVALGAALPRSSGSEAGRRLKTTRATHRNRGLRNEPSPIAAARGGARRQLSRMPWTRGRSPRRKPYCSPSPSRSGTGRPRAYPTGAAETLVKLTGCDQGRSGGIRPHHRPVRPAGRADLPAAWSPPGSRPPWL